MANVTTTPRQVRVLKCVLRAPGLEFRAANAEDAKMLREHGFNITPFVQRVDIYESIFDNTISGSVTLLENIGLPEYLPIVGVETFNIIFEVDDEKGNPKRFARAFRVTKVHNQTFPRHDWRLYTLQFATNEFVQSISTRISRRFANVTCEEAVRQILTKDLGVSSDQIITDEKTRDKVTVVIPTYTPLQAINYFTVLARTAEKPHESNFLFFETLEGFHFTSIRRLILDAPKSPKVFNVDPGQVTNAPFALDAAVRNSALRVHQPQTFDLLSDIASGTLRSRMVHIDILARAFDHQQDSRYTDTFKQTTHLDQYPAYPQNFDLSVGKDVRQFIVPSNLWTAEQNKETAEQNLREAIVLRNRQMHEIRHLQTLIELPGQPDLRAGTVVIVKYPSTKALEGRNVSINTPVYSDGTPYHSGKHLVTSVHHILTGTGAESMDYRVNVQVCRDSLGAPLVGTTNETGK